MFLRRRRRICGYDDDMIKEVIVKAIFSTRSIIDDTQSEYDMLLKYHIEKMESMIWNKIQSLKREDLKNLIVEIKDFGV